jgi:hypothetical protein
MGGGVHFRVFSGVLAAVCLTAAVAQGDVFISELLADNEEGIEDEDGTRQDWLELYNSGDAVVSLDGWWLTDKAANVTQWRVPNVSLPAKGTLLVWASGKNRANPAAPLHANFSLSKDGEYLGLYRPDPSNGLPVLVDEFAPKFPALPPDVSYGRMKVAQVSTRVPSGAVARYRVITPTEGAAVYSGTNYASGQVGQGQPGGWNVSAGFDDSAWPLAQTPVGWDNGNKYTFGTTPSGNIKSALYNINTSLLLRLPFAVADPSAVAGLTLRVRYEDGFVAFVNGVEVLRANGSADPLEWNSKSDVAFDKPNPPPEIDVTLASAALLTSGTNVLALQGLNASSGSSDFFLDAELSVIEQADSMTTGYFAVPTPGTLNGVGAASLLLSDAEPEDPYVPRPLGTLASPPLTVTVRVTKTKNNVSAVRAYSRIMYNAEAAAVPMLDNGVWPDAVTNDGVYTASLPTTTVLAGQMFRWRFEAQDVSNVVTKLPAYAAPLDSPQYFGTVAVDSTTAASQLPVLEWFVQGAPANGPTAAAFRGCCYCLSNFYDNTGHEIHGQSTSGFAKKSYDFDFTDAKRFLWQAGERRVKDINLLSNYADKTKTRNAFTHWVGQTAGTPHHFCFPVRVHLNGVFHGVMDLMEDGDDRMLARNGLDPEGALYKIYNTDILTSVEKKTPKGIDFSDLRELTNGLCTARNITNRQVYAYDNVDVAATVNYLVVRFLNSDQDHGHKNYYLYRDTHVTREWQPIIWDVDLSQGHVWNSTENYFDDDLITNVLFAAGSGSAVYSVVYNSPEMKQMFVRRMRTLMDGLMQAPGTTNGLFEAKMREIVATVDPDPADPSPWTDGDLDAARWGIDYRFIQNRPREEVERVITDYFAKRRAFMFNKGAGRPTYSAVPIPDEAQTNVPGMVTIDAIDFLPASGTQAHEYVILRNTTAQAVDVSGWKVKGQISHTFKGGTVIPAGAGTAGANYIGLLHVAKDANAFRTRPSGPTGGQRRFVQGNYSGQLSARGGAVRVYDAANLLIATTNYAGSPLPTQRNLRITELQYHPADPTPEEAAALVGVKDDDFEYLELMNTGADALTLTGAYFSQGIGYTFPTSSLAGGARVVLAKLPAAFALRYPSCGAPVFGPYEGNLDNGGERLELTDLCGENILDFEYKDGWCPASDGSGRSLVLRDTNTAYNAFGNAVSWGLSGSADGSPGSSDAWLSQAYYGWDNGHFTESERENPLVSGLNADPDGDGRVNWVEYALDSDPWVSDAYPIGLAWETVLAQRHAALLFRRPSHAIDITYELLAAGDLAAGPWGVIGGAVWALSPLDAGRESVSVRDPDAALLPARFYRLRLTYQGE